MRNFINNSKVYIITITCVLIFIGVVFLYKDLSKDKRKTVSYDELTQREQGEPYSDWGESPTGSVRYLDGDTVLVSIFLEDTSAQWSDYDRELIHKNLKIACDYLEREGEYYGKDVNIIYNFKTHSDLEYHMEYNQYLDVEDINISDEDIRNSRYNMLFNNANEFIVNKIPIEDIMKKYDVNSIGFLIFVDDKASEAGAYSYYEGGTYNHYEEMAFIPLRWKSTGENVSPDTYAHEILHLFGARDLYTTSKLCGVTKDFVIYAAEEFPSDIMLGHAADITVNSDKIDTEITKITAYFLGWTNYISELEKFPSVKLKKPAVFSVVNDNQGNYSDYTYETRKHSEDSGYNKFLTVFLIIYFSLSLARIISADMKKKKVEENIDKNNYF